MAEPAAQPQRTVTAEDFKTWTWMKADHVMRQRNEASARLVTANAKIQELEKTIKDKDATQALAETRITELETMVHAAGGPDFAMERLKAKQRQMALNKIAEAQNLLATLDAPAEPPQQ